jgi:metal-responsive CopG/Arc/MetJ family transcriptional regulator
LLFLAGDPKMPETTTEQRRVHMFAPVRLINRVDEWRRQQRDVPNLSEAIRRLIEMSLDAAEKKKSGKHGR